MGVKNWFKKKKSKNKKESKNPSEKRGIKKVQMGKHEFQKWQKTTTSIQLEKTIGDNFALSKEYIDTLERYIPNINASIWTWKCLCNTDLKIQFNGGTSNQRNKAEKITSDLSKKINPLKAVQGSGFNNLLDIYFEHYFKYGRTSGLIEYNKDLTGIEKYQIINPFNVKFTKNDLKPILIKKNESYYLNENNFYYNAQNADNENPYGIGMIESSPSLVKINDDLLRDMANSSSNAGVPRLHIKIDQPDQMERETDKAYVARVNEYFDDTVDNLSNVGSDENFYTWKEMDIGIAGGSQGSAGFVWRVNRQMIDEEMITAFHLFPWVLAKSTGTTKNWVQAQFDLLMTEADSIQKDATDFIEWIIKRELLLNGITNIEPVVTLTRFRDPAVKNIAIAERFKINNVLTKVQNGMIDPDEGAREMGRKKWFDKSLIHKKEDNQDDNEKPKEKVDESEQPVDKGGDTKVSPDQK